MEMFKTMHEKDKNKNKNKKENGIIVLAKQHYAKIAQNMEKKYEMRMVEQKMRRGARKNEYGSRKSNHGENY